MISKYINYLNSRQGHWSIADALLKEDASGSKQIDSSGRTALMIASLEGHLGKKRKSYYYHYVPTNFYLPNLPQSYHRAIS